PLRPCLGGRPGPKRLVHTHLKIHPGHGAFPPFLAVVCDNFSIPHRKTPCNRPAGRVYWSCGQGPQINALYLVERTAAGGKSNMERKPNARTRRLTQLALLLALVLIMSYTPLGYLPVGPLVLSLLTIPVAVGAIVMGPASGA